jgi:hypothetical protein
MLHAPDMQRDPLTRFAQVLHEDVLIVEPPSATKGL